MFDTGSYFSLEGQTAIVTGGTTGLGLAITRCMGQEQRWRCLAMRAGNRGGKP